MGIIPMHLKPAMVIYTSTYCMNNTAEHLSLTKSFENFPKQNLFLKIWSSKTHSITKTAYRKLIALTNLNILCIYIVHALHIQPLDTSFSLKNYSKVNNFQSIWHHNHPRYTVYQNCKQFPSFSFFWKYVHADCTHKHTLRYIHTHTMN